MIEIPETGSEYVFEGEVIKLNARDFYKWADMYKGLDLVIELQQLDEEFSIKLREGWNGKGWFSQAYSRFNGRNKIALDKLARMPHAYSRGQLVAPRLTKEMSLEQQIGDTSWATGIKTIN